MGESVRYESLIYRDEELGALKEQLNYFVETAREIAGTLIKMLERAKNEPLDVEDEWNGSNHKIGFTFWGEEWSGIRQRTPMYHGGFSKSGGTLVTKKIPKFYLDYLNNLISCVEETLAFEELPESLDDLLE